MPTEVVKTIRSAGGDYTSLSAWTAAEQRDLVVLGEIAVAELYNDWVGDGLEDRWLPGALFASSADCYCVLRAANGHRHTGTRGTGARFWKSGNFQAPIDLSPYGRVSGVEIKYAGSPIAVAMREFSQIDSCIISSTYGLVNTNQKSYTRIFNNLCIRDGTSTSSGIITGNFAGNTLVYNNVFDIGSALGNTLELYNAASNIVRNNVFIGGGPETVAITTTVFENNATSKSSAESAISGTTGAIFDVPDTDFVDAANNDFHLSATSGLRGQGVNLYSDFQHDIDGDEWPNAGAWDIGFDHYVVAGPTYNVTLSSPTATVTSSTTATVGCTVTYT